MSAIVIEDLSKAYGPIRALDGLSLEVKPGQVFGFLGPNGAGKTTTLRILAGLAHPTAGRAWIEGMLVGGGSPARHQVGYLPEEPGFYPWMRAREFLADLIGGLYGQRHSDARQRSEEVLALVGLEEAADRRIGGFSRGMRQRLGLAQALMNHPRVLLLDEPVSALDPGGRHDILALIGQLAKQTTIFMSTHILSDVERICDVIGILDHGRLIALDAREDLLGRYATPAIEVTFDAPAHVVEGWSDTLTAVSMIKDLKLSGSTVRIMLDGLPQSAIEMQRLALGAGLPVLNYQHARPQLEDVFLQLVR